jgi:hypothetical protein
MTYISTKLNTRVSSEWLVIALQQKNKDIFLDQIPQSQNCGNLKSRELQKNFSQLTDSRVRHVVINDGRKLVSVLGCTTRT